MNNPMLNAIMDHVKQSYAYLEKNPLFLLIAIIASIAITVIAVKVICGVTIALGRSIGKHGQSWLKKNTESRRQRKLSEAHFEQHAHMHQKFLAIKAAADQSDALRKAQEQTWLEEQEKLKEQEEAKLKIARSRQVRINNITKFRNLFGCRPAQIKVRPDGSHLAYWHDVEVGLSRLAGRIYTEQKYVLRRFPSNDDYSELIKEYEDARLLIKRYCKALYALTRPWAGQLKLLAPPPARPARQRGYLLVEKTPERSGKRRSRKSRKGKGEVIDAEVVG